MAELTQRGNENSSKMDSEIKREYDQLGFIKRLLCPYCGSECLKVSHVDDVGTEWFKCEKCGRYSTKAKTKERREFEEALASSEKDLIHVGKTAVKPLFNGLSKKVHPAIDVVDDLAVVGITLPCIVVDANGKQNEKELSFLITSNRDKILCNTEILTKIKWKLAYKIVSFENRWSLKGIQSFLNGEPVDPKYVYSMVKEAWQNYIEFENQEYYDLITLWTVGTYFFHLFSAYPYIYVGGLKQTGKTKVLTVASFMCFNAIFSNNISTSSIYRLIQSGRCTLLMDETEKLGERDRATELRNLLLAGYKKGAKVYRTEKTSGERLVPEAFEVYSPKMIANIRGIEDVLEDRCITIIMKRGKNRDITNREPDGGDEHWQKIRDSLYNFYLSYFKEFIESCVGCEGSECRCTGISERELELWKPILTLAKFFDKHFPNLNIPERIRKLAETKAEEKKTENMTETGEYLLVQTLLNIVKDNEECYYPVRKIKDFMAQAFDEEQKWLSSEWVGRALKRLGFTDKRRVGTGCEYKLSAKAIIDLAERLNIPVNNARETDAHVTQPSQPTHSTQPTLAEKLEQIKTWLLENKDENGLISCGILASKIKELDLDVQQTVKILKDEYWLRDTPTLGKFGVK